MRLRFKPSLRCFQHDAKSDDDDEGGYRSLSRAWIRTFSSASLMVFRALRRSLMRLRLRSSFSATCCFRRSRFTFTCNTTPDQHRKNHHTQFSFRVKVRISTQQTDTVRTAPHLLHSKSGSGLEKALPLAAPGLSCKAIRNQVQAAKLTGMIGRVHAQQMTRFVMPLTRTIPLTPHLLVGPVDGGRLGDQRLLELVQVRHLQDQHPSASRGHLLTTRD
jgi:hypothetical protein